MVAFSRLVVAASVAGVAGVRVGQMLRATAVTAAGNSPENLQSLLDNPALMQARFQRWVEENDKPYVVSGQLQNLPNGSTVYEARYNVFTDNVARAHALNHQHQGSATFGINKFADLTSDEFKAGWKGLKLDDGWKDHMAGLPQYQPKLGAQDVPDSIDWRGTATTAVKDQGQCGSCWAFSATESLESAHMMEQMKAGSRYGQSEKLSSQETVSCDIGADGGAGCNGGNPVQAMQWMQTEGVELNSDYPYTSGITERTGKCKLVESKEVLNVKDFEVVSMEADDEYKMHSWLKENGPMSVAVDAGQFQLYTDGILKADTCGDQLDHAVQVVGQGKADDFEGTKYWIVRNSWGAEWGEAGYIRVEADANACGIAEMVSGVTATAPAQDMDVETVLLQTGAHTRTFMGRQGAQMARDCVEC